MGRGIWTLLLVLAFVLVSCYAILLPSEAQGPVRYGVVRFANQAEAREVG